MRYNKQELMALASQTSKNFDREGVLVLKERQNSFFRRSEGCSVRWFRLRGNLLFYLKGPEPWYEPMGVIILGCHQIIVQNQDDNGHWPFQIVWENGVCYRMATFHESERTLWLKAIEMAPYDKISLQLATLKERLNRIRPVIDIATYRLQKGIIPDMNEVPLCELALTCDNLLCDTHGIPPSPVIVVYVKFQRGLCLRYGSTEIVHCCSNPCFSKTILFRASDGLTGDAVVRLVAFDVRERVSDTAVPLGFTALQLSTIQEAQRLRVALQTQENKLAGFVTMNGWSLEPAYIGTSPSHSNDRNSIEIPQKVLCHRRSQSLPPRLGLKLKFPSYGSLLKQNFVNSFQVTYRFHSGLGGDITVHEIIAEPKLCYAMPIQLLDIYYQRERELLEELLSVGEVCVQWADRQLELVSTHVSLLKHYGHCKRRLLHVDTPYFKPSCKKDEASLEFAPVNLHLQRMWVNNDTLNKTGLHDIVSAGAFAAHTQRSERNDGLIRLVQQMKDINHSKTALHSMANKFQADYDNVIALRRFRDAIVNDMERVVVLLQAKQDAEIRTVLEEIKMKSKSLTSLWDPHSVEDSLSYIKFPNQNGPETMSVILRYTDRLSYFDQNPDTDTYASSSSSSKETSPTADVSPMQNLSSSVPNICPSTCSKNNNNTINEEPELQFHNDYFKHERVRESNHSFRSVRSARLSSDGQDLQFESPKLRTGSLRHDFKSSTSLEQVSYRGLMGNQNGNKNKNPDLRSESLRPRAWQLDSNTRENNLVYLRGVGCTVTDELNSVYDAVLQSAGNTVLEVTEELEEVRSRIEKAKHAMEAVVRWTRVAHAALRLRCESPQWTRDHAALQTRRDACFSQALTTVTAGLLCWLCSVPGDTVVKILSSGLGPLCGFEGLLSLYAQEKAMWGDMVVAVEDLQTVQFTLTKVGHSNSAVPQVTGVRGALVVRIPVSDSLYSRFTNKKHLTFTITVVFFNIGVNEKATMAEALGETTPQYHSNSDNLDRLCKYYHKYSKLVYDHASDTREISVGAGEAAGEHSLQQPHLSCAETARSIHTLLTPINSAEIVPTPCQILKMMLYGFRSYKGTLMRLLESTCSLESSLLVLHNASSSSRSKPLEEVMENLRIVVHKKTPKNVEVLHLAALATRLMNGIRFTSCKSAKDRTGMSVTLEQCSILAAEYHLAEHEQKKALDIMRSEGCRRENTLKNIGVRKYAFTKKQVMALPKDYRPPPGTYGSTQT